MSREVFVERELEILHLELAVEEVVSLQSELKTKCNDFVEDRALGSVTRSPVGMTALRVTTAGTGDPPLERGWAAIRVYVFL